MTSRVRLPGVHTLVMEVQYTVDLDQVCDSVLGEMDCTLEGIVFEFPFCKTFPLSMKKG